MQERSRQDTATRTILHVDMDAFYVSVELRRHPELRGRPVVVGGSGSRGVVAAANYEARRFGVFSAMSSSKARRLCPDAIFIGGDHEFYSQVSRDVMAIFEDFTPVVEPVALDEAFLDVSGSVHLFGEGASIASTIRARVAAELDLPCSVGVASSKFIAKLASKSAKPTLQGGRILPGPGVLVVEPGYELEFIRPLPVSALWGVGPVTLTRLEKLGVRTVADLGQVDINVLEQLLGKAHGRHLHDLAHGLDERAVIAQREAKSIGREETYIRDLDRLEDIRSEVTRLCDDVAERVRSHGQAARTITLKIRRSTFETVTRSTTPGVPLSTGAAMAAALEPLVARIDIGSGIRLLGVSASGLCEPVEQLSLLDAIDSDPSRPDTRERKWNPASTAIDAIRSKFGKDAITSAGAFQSPQRSSPWGPRKVDDEAPDVR